MLEFQSAHPVGARRGDVDIAAHPCAISIHAPRAGCDHRRAQGGQSPPSFNPRTPCGVRRRGSPELRRLQDISIHAPRAGCDLLSPAVLAHSGNFNPRTPCGVRQASAVCGSRTGCDFNPRTPCGVRPLSNKMRVVASDISIHAPRAGCDYGMLKAPVKTCISIHAPRAGCDLFHPAMHSTTKDFNPRTPCGVRRVYPSPLPPRGCRFQSTHPVRGATAHGCVRGRRVVLFQSTHPVRGATVLRGIQDAIAAADFNPRTPCGVRRSFQEYRR